MSRTTQQLRNDLLAIWNAGVAGVHVDRLIRNTISLRGNNLQIGEESYRLSEIDRVVVIGGGKASGAMAESLETVLEPLFERKEVTGWINVPSDCAKPLKKIILHPARPMGVNEPTEAAVAGTNKMLDLAKSLTPHDLCLCLISGGGSALLPAPVPEVSLSEKLELTRFLSESGATIQELNTVRKQISRIKGGGLKAICQGKRLISLILSDVLGDPLDVIASGPTVDSSSSAADAINVLRKFVPNIAEKSVAESAAESAKMDEADSVRQRALIRIYRYLEQKNRNDIPRSAVCDLLSNCRNIIIGNLTTAVEAASEEAAKRGYSCTKYVARKSEGLADDLGAELADTALAMAQSGSDCLIHGGEPVVKLAPAGRRGLGGRNQQLVLAALIRLKEQLKSQNAGEIPGIALLSGGTDGEDGPTDAAGAWIDPIFWTEFQKKINSDSNRDLNFEPEEFLRNNDAYHFFEPLGTLLKTGATGTNVCDLRVVLSLTAPQTDG